MNLGCGSAGVSGVSVGIQPDTEQAARQLNSAGFRRFRGGGGRVCDADPAGARQKVQGLAGYSARSATDGSIWAARRAGSAQAAIATSPSNTPITPNVIGSVP